MHRSLILAVVLLAAPLDIALAQRALQVDWEIATRRGVPRLRGYVSNDHPGNAGNVVLAVETLDASGAVVSRSTHGVRGTVPPFGRLFYEIPVGDSPGSAYRVTVVAAEWFGGGGGP